MPLRSDPCQPVTLPAVLDRVQVQTVPASLLRDIDNAESTTCELDTLRNIVGNQGTKANVNGAGVITYLGIEQVPVYTQLSIRQSRKPRLILPPITNPLNPLNSTTIIGIQPTQVDAYTDILKVNNYNASLLV
jgi:hypothetical protein